MNYKVYTLADPRNGSVRYVGFTSRALKARWEDHVHGNKTKDHKGAWIRSLKKEGLHPKIELLEEFVQEDDALEAETYWITVLRYLGLDLVNIAEGGGKPPSAKGRKHKPETVAFMKATYRPPDNTGMRRSAESKRKMSLVQSKLIRSEAQLARFCAINIGRKHSEETKAKTSQRFKGKPKSAEHKSKIAAAHLGKKQTEEHKQNAKRRRAESFLNRSTL